MTALSLPHIASWQIERLREDRFRGVQAVLPALQRGAVWRSGQVEALWDSIERRFPVGMFLLSDFREDLGVQKMLLQQRRSMAEPTHMLLDGQQRANAIALGYYSPWRQRDEDAPAALWLDLKLVQQSETQTAYRVVTRAHPWGYPHRDKQRLELREIRLAMSAFRLASPQVQWHDRPPVCVSWPWEATLPIPVSVLLNASSVAPDDVLEELSHSLPFWRSIETAKGPLTEEALVAALRRHSGRLAALHETARCYQIPAQMVQLAAPEEARGQDTSTTADPTETLFVRVNAAGTPLQGEDLVYSVIKAIWPDAAAVVDQLKKRFVSAPRAAMLVARLALAEESGSSIPAVIDVTRFRRLVHEPGRSKYRRRLESYLQSGAAALFENAYELLTGSEYGLPPVLAADLARGEEGREVILVLLRWIERLEDSGVRLSHLSNQIRRRTIGALTCIRWFAPRPDRCAAVLWNLLEECPDGKLPTFFGRASIGKCFEPVKNQVPIRLVPPPALLLMQVRSRVIPSRGPSGSVGNPKSKLWRHWNWYDSYQSNPVPPLQRWYKASMPQLSRFADVLDIEDASSALEARIEEWSAFADKVWGERRLVLYAQRAALKSWFPKFDPTDPESVEETNRPWDMDHIHPRYFVEKRRNMPKLIKDWHSCIGNLRAWPFEANRADAEGLPCLKLEKVVDPVEDQYEATVLEKYGLLDPRERQKASFVGRDLKLWSGSTPGPNEHVQPAYLASPSSAGYREKLLKAIVTRMAGLYEEWYRTLDIGALLPTAIPASSGSQSAADRDTRLRKKVA